MVSNAERPNTLYLTRAINGSPLISIYTREVLKYRLATITRRARFMLTSRSYVNGEATTAAEFDRYTHVRPVSRCLVRRRLLPVLSATSGTGRGSPA